MGIPLLLLLAAAVPTLIVSVYMDWLDRRQPEPRSALRRVYLAGIISVAPVLLLEMWLSTSGVAESGLTSVLWRAFVVAAIPEEGAKVICIALMVWRSPAFDEQMDGITYGVRAGLGFALVENFGFFLTAPDASLVPVLIARSVFLVPGHAAWGAIAGYWAARRRFTGRGIGGVGGWMVAVCLHGTYDLFIFSAKPLRMLLPDAPWIVWICTTAAIVVLVFSVVWARVLARQALHEDERLDASVIPTSTRGSGSWRRDGESV